MITRLTSATSVCDNADFLRKVYADLARRNLTTLTFDAVLRKLCLFAPRVEQSYIAFAGEPAECFCFFVETTRPFDPGIVFTAECFYHCAGERQATEQLTHSVLTWARQRAPATVVIPTRRDSGAAVRFFKKYGFFKQDINFQQKV